MVESSGSVKQAPLAAYMRMQRDQEIKFRCDGPLRFGECSLVQQNLAHSYS